MFWSATAGGFYLPEIHGAAIPEDAVEITAEQHGAMLAAQSAGASIQAGTNGLPEAVFPPQPDLLDQARVTAKVGAAAALAARIAAGLAWDDSVLQIDEASQGRLAAAAQIAALGSLPAGFEWRMADNTALPLDAAGMLAMATAAGERVYALRARYWTLVDAVRAASTVDAVGAIDVTAGWPA